MKYIYSQKNSYPNEFHQKNIIKRFTKFLWQVLFEYGYMQQLLCLRSFSREIREMLGLFLSTKTGKYMPGYSRFYLIIDWINYLAVITANYISSSFLVRALNLHRFKLCSWPDEFCTYKHLRCNNLAGNKADKFSLRSSVLEIHLLVSSLTPLFCMTCFLTCVLLPWPVL